MTATKKMSAFLLPFFLLSSFACWYYISQQPRYDMLFVHGLFNRNRDVSRSKNWYKKHLFGSEQNLQLASFNFSEIDKGLLASPLGQGEDIDRLIAFYKENPNLGALSECRGSSSLIFALAREKLVLPFAILNAPLISIRSLVYYQIKRFGLSYMLDLVPMFPSVAERAAHKLFPYHKLNGEQPIDVVDQIHLGTPFLLIVSKADQWITPNDTRHLYIKLKKLGHEVYVYEAEGEHCKGVRPKVDPNCRKVVNAFLAQVNATHNQELASEGKELFAQCQPSVKEMRKRMKKDLKFCNRPFKAKNRNLFMMGGALGLGAAAHTFGAGSLGTALFAGIVGHQLILPAIIFVGSRIVTRIISQKGL